MRGGMMLAAFGAMLSACQPAARPAPAASANDFSVLVVEPRTIVQLHEEMDGGGTAASITQSYLDRIASVDDAGPTLNAVIVVNPNALPNAQALDGLKAGGV